MRFVPVELCRAGRAIVETDLSDPLSLAPASRTVDPTKPGEFAMPGDYAVEFGLGTQTYPVSLSGPARYTQAHLVAGPTCPRPIPHGA